MSKMFFKLNINMAFSLTFLCSAVTAYAEKISDSTERVKGRAPVAMPIFAPATSKPGDTLSVTYFSDADGDEELGSSLQWTRNGVEVSGATASTFKLSQDWIGGDLINILITPRTSPMNSDPSEGISSSASQPHRVGSTLLASFTTPDNLSVRPTVADKICSDKGMRLPTTLELKSLFLDATQAVVEGTENSDMCTVHGWPIRNQCGGEYYGSAYWTSDADPTNPSRRMYVYLNFGSAFPDAGNNSALVTCLGLTPAP